MFWQKFKDWLKQPYDNEMDALHWFLFLGLVLILTVAWRRILNHVIEA